MKLCHSRENGPADDGLHFQYYVIDGTTIIGLLEKPVIPGNGWFQMTSLLSAHLRVCDILVSLWCLLQYNCP